MCMFYSDAFTDVLFVTAQIKTQGLNFSYSMIKKNCRREGVEMNQHVWWVAGKMESLPPPSKGLFSSQTLVLKYYGHCLLFFFYSSEHPMLQIFQWSSLFCFLYIIVIHGYIPRPSTCHAQMLPETIPLFSLAARAHDWGLHMANQSTDWAPLGNLSLLPRMWE